MLRIRYTDRDAVFESRNIRKDDCRKILEMHLGLWMKVMADKKDPSTTYEIPKSHLIAEWQDGDGEWDDAKPVENIPIP